jgi:hypothetical protein
MSKSGKPNFMNKPLFQSPLSKPLDIYALPNLSHIYYNSNEKMGDSLKQKQTEVSNLISNTIKQKFTNDSIKLPEYSTLQTKKAMSPPPEYHNYGSGFGEKNSPQQTKEISTHQIRDNRYTPYTIVHNGPINYQHSPNNAPSENNPYAMNTFDKAQNQKQSQNASLDISDSKHSLTYRAGSNNTGSRALIDSYEYGIQRRDGVKL